MPQPKFVSALSKSTKIFFGQETSAGIVMLLAAFIAILIANSPLSNWYQGFISDKIAISWGNHSFSANLDMVVKDILMVLFFFNIGMELKREMVDGFLRKPSQIFAPLIAATFGMIIPAIIYISINFNNPTYLHGWAIPCATDIAFAVCILALAGKNIDPTVKIFLLAIAVFDDIGSIIIIALFYGNDISIMPMALSCIIVLALISLNILQISALFFYAILGVLLWICFHNAGIHTTIAGVIVGLAIPFKCTINDNKVLYPLNDNIRLFTPWVNFLILPIFAFTEGGVDFRGITIEDLLSPISLGVALGLFFGKQIGIFGATYILIKMKLAQFPKAVNLKHIYGVSLLSGIGFTMSLFVSKLAFDNIEMQDMAKIGIIIACIFSSLIGLILFRLAKNK